MRDPYIDLAYFENRQTYVDGIDRDLNIPFAFFITKDDEIFNPVCSAQNEVLSSEITDVLNHLDYDYILNKYNEVSNNYSRIVHDGQITKEDFYKYLPYIAKFTEGYINYDVALKGKHILMLTRGCISAYKNIYEFFLKLLNQNIDDIQTTIHEIENYSCGHTSEFLVRFCGFAKLQTSVYHMISTSDNNYEYNLSRFIRDGWQVLYFPPYKIIDGKVVMDDPAEESLIRKYHV